LADHRAEGDPRPVVVLESFGPPNPMTNPYLTQLFASFPASVEAHHMNWRRALVGHFDVFHVHWPEVLIRADTIPRRVLRMTRFVLLLLRIRLQHKGLVRTLHNVAPHEPPGWLLGRVLELTDRWTTLWIVLSSDARTPTDAPTALIPHGHYRDWFEGMGRPEVEPGLIMHFGLIRPYKGVEELVSVFSSMPAPELRLRIVGEAIDPDLARSLRVSADADDRVTIVDRHVSDAELAREVSASELVVLPFVKTTTSGSMLLALSLDRPVLVPRTPYFEQIATEVGNGWVATYEGPLTKDALSIAMETVRSNPPLDRPDLSARDWDRIGSLHAEAFERARVLSSVTG
jgi:beta-1,4-mannosyltransferase